jgi:hypothetical protein
MDGSFACPECGSSVEVAGLAPGRQVRCGFCNRLLEVPYLPRAADAQWKRRRFARPKWFLWACVALAVASVALLGAGTLHFVTRQYDSARQRSINQLLDSAKLHEAECHFDQALIDLDTAIEVARKAGPTYLARIDDWTRKRPDLARREVQTAIDRLSTSDPSSFRLGNWLTLIARAEKDPDLAPLADSIQQQFRAALGRQVDIELLAARRSAESKRVLDSLAACERIATLLDHLSPEKATAMRTDTAELVVRLISQHGVTIAPPKGHFVFGPQTYVKEIVPFVVKAFEAKGYLPYRESTHWQAQWKHARFLATIVVSEQLEGNYLSSANRLTRIEVQLLVTSAADGSLVFETRPTARSTVPLPKLPAYLSNRLATSERTEELERLLYDDARGQISGKLGNVLPNMPAWRAAQAINPPGRK